MQRRFLPEIDDQPWLPCSLRDGLTDSLRFMTTAARPYCAAEELLAMARVADPADDWHAGGTSPSLASPPITYLIGTPRSTTNEPAKHS